MAKPASQLTKVIATCLVTLFLLTATIFGIAKWILFPFKKPVHAHKVFDYSIGNLKGNQWWSLSVGPNADPLVVIANIETGNDTAVNLKAIAKQCADRTLDCTIFHLAGDKLEQVHVTNIPGPYLTAQPFGKSQFLLATATSLKPAGEFNGFVYDMQGNVVRMVKLGVDLNQLECDAAGNLWTTYDTSKYTNAAINSGGLVCLDNQMNVLFRFNDKVIRKGLPALNYGLALNVTSDKDVSVCPNRDGSIVKIVNGAVDKVLKCYQASGCLALASSGSRLLFDKCDIAENRMMVADVEHNQSYYVNPVDDSGNDIGLEQRGFAARGSRLYFTDKKTVYFIDLAEIKD